MLNDSLRTGRREEVTVSDRLASDGRLRDRINIRQVVDSRELVD